MNRRWIFALCAAWVAACGITAAAFSRIGDAGGSVALLLVALACETAFAAAVYFYAESRFFRPAELWRVALDRVKDGLPAAPPGPLSPLSDAVATRFARASEAFSERLREQETRIARIDTLERELEELRAHLVTKIQELRGIHEVTTAVAGSLDLDELFRVIPDKVSPFLGLNDFCILLFQEDTRRLVCKSGCAVPDDWGIAPGEGVSGKVFLSGEPVYIPDVRSEPDFLYYGGARTDLRSFVCIPLMSRGKPIGVLNVHHKEPNAFDAESIAAMRILAAHIAIAIENAGMFRFVRTLAEKDSLTMLYNHGAFHERLAVELERASRYGRHLSVIMLDLDAFKEINDTHGHVVGDRILAMTSAVLCAHLRKSDIPARYGGDEFAVILPETDLAAASTIAMRIAAGISQVRFDTEKGETISFTASIGYATCAPDSTGRMAVLSVADRLMYESKRRGRGGVLGEQI